MVQLFERACELPEGQRRAYLEALSEPPGLIAEVLALLEADAAATESFLTPPAAREIPPDQLGPPSTPGRFGPYRLLHELGHGGMGTVFLAVRDDGQFDDRVAIKVLHGVHSAQQRRRFLVERQILASLRHAHIAYLLDGGLAEGGVPYLVMELVQGLPIDEYCRRERLTVAERLRLFLQVASAVEHAHRNLVVHRDLKPSNILVTAADSDVGAVKLLDFGIAKILDDADPKLTRTGHRMLTPSYASPEQVRGDAVTTSSDVYQLGVLLYELLAGSRPFDSHRSSSPLEAAMAVLDHDPEAPSKAASRSTAHRPPHQARTTIPASKDPGTPPTPTALPAADFVALSTSQKNDLDAIVLTAIAKEPDRRFASVQALAADVLRFLDGRPVEARGAGAGYRFGKWVRRNKAGAIAAAAAALLAVSVVTSGALALVQARRLELERSRAEAEAAKANAVAGFLADVFAGADPEHHDGKEPTARELLELGAARIDGLDEADSRLALTAIMARAFSSLGDQPRARALAVQRLELARQVGSSLDLAEALEELSTIDRFAGSFDDSAGWLDEAQPLREDAATDGDRAALSGLAGYLRLRGELERDRGNWTDAAGALTRSSSIYSELAASAASEDDRERAEGGEAWALTSLTGVLHYLGKIEEAEGFQRRALDIYARLEGPRSLEALNARHNLAMILWQRGDTAAALPMNQEVIDGFRSIYGGDHLNLAAVLGNQALVLREAERFEDARRHLHEALEMQRRILPAKHPNIASSLHNLGAIEVIAGRPGDGEPSLRDALAMRLETLGESHPSVGSSAAALADALRDQGRWEESLPLRRQAVAILEASLPADHPRLAEARAALDQTQQRLAVGVD